MHRVFVALGSNVGDRAGHLRTGLSALDRLPGTRVIARAGVYETAPVGPVPQDDYLNTVVELSSELTPEELHEGLCRIEQASGRPGPVGRVKWGPRTLDLDILLYDDRVLVTPLLTVPHPRMHLRRFVLRPMCDIDAEVVHPALSRSMRDLLAALPEDEQAVRLMCEMER